eukprot:Lankesteria_metandrocarpae@DN7435_c0_g1_i1.p1
MASGSTTGSTTVEPDGLRSALRAQLDEAILEYLLKRHPETGKHFQEESHVALRRTIASSSSVADDILVKKWLATTRLTLRLNDVEKRLKEANNKLQLHEVIAGLKQPTNALPSKIPAAPLLGHRDAITALAFHPHFGLLISASEDWTIRVWTYEGGTATLAKSLQSHTNVVTDIAFDSDEGRLFASGSADTSVKLWDISTLEVLRVFQGHDDAVTRVCFLRCGSSNLPWSLKGLAAPGELSKVLDGLILSASRDRSFKIWDCSTGDCLKTCCHHTEPVKAVASFHPSVTLFATCSADFTVSVWNIEGSASGGGAIGSSRLAAGRRRSVSTSILYDSGVPLEPVCNLTGHSHVVEDVLFASE